MDIGCLVWYRSNPKSYCKRHVLCTVVLTVLLYIIVGTLTNSAVSELVSKILSLEDIHEDDAHSLVTLLTEFSDNVQREVIATVSLVHEIPLAKLVPCWARLQEMRSLCAGLHLIMHRTNGLYRTPNPGPIVH